MCTLRILLFVQPPIGRSPKPDMAIGSCSTSTTIHTMVPSRIVWVGLFGEVGSAVSGPCASAPFATGPIKVPCRPLIRLQGGFDTRAVCCRSFSYSRIAEFRSAPSSFLVFRMLLSSSCVGGILGRATVVVNQLREDSKRPIQSLKIFCLARLLPPDTWTRLC